MYKEESINIYYKAFCFILFMVVIFGINSVISLISLFIFFYLINRQENNYMFLWLLLVSLFCLAISNLTNNLLYARLIMATDYCYYFIKNIGINNLLLLKNIFSNRKCDYLELKKNYEKQIVTNVNNEIDNELKKGDMLKQEELDIINGKIVDKVHNDILQKLKNNYLRFYKHKRSYISFKYNYKSDLYLLFHVMILVLSVVVGLCAI